MARGFLRGAVWGGFTSICAAGVVSVIAEGPVPPTVNAEAPATNAAPEPAATDAAQPREDRVPVTGQEAPKAPAPLPDTLAAVRQETLRTAAQPETGDAAQMADPQVENGAGGIETGVSERSAVSNPQALGLTAPVVEPGVSVSTDPAEPPAREPVDATEELALSEDPVQPDAPALTTEPSAPVVAPADPLELQDAESSISTDPVQPPVPEVPSETEAFAPDAPAPEAAPAAVETPSASAEAPVPQPSQTEVAVPTTTPADSAQPAPETAEVAPPALPEDTEEAPELAPEDVLAGIGRPVGTLENLAPDVQINRLPTLGEPTPEAFDEVAVPESDESAVELDLSLRPVDQFAAAHDNPDGKPAMAIVLMDDGVDLSRETIGLPALRSFPYPISFAVDSSLPDAAARMSAYRAEGFEVLAIVNLPPGAQAQDAEVSLSVALEAVPEAVGVLEGIGEGVQGSRDAAVQVTEILAETGHGFVTQNRGLNTVQKLAARAGVPSAVVFRDFDDKGQSPTVIRRFLDQAAFRAGRDGAVIMLGRLREETISALLLWGLQDRAEQVALVPVTAVLSTQQ